MAQRPKIRNERGLALAAAIAIIMILVLLAGYVTQLSYNQKKLSASGSGQRVRNYYRAQAGVVDAGWRIRANYTVGLPNGGTAPFNFTNDGYNPGPYNLDVDGDGAVDCTVDIGAVTNAATKQRPILSTGLDV